MKKLNLKNAVIISEEIIKQTADIIGPQSAAQAALDKAKEYENPIFLRQGSTIIVIDNCEKS